MAPATDLGVADPPPLPPVKQQQQLSPASTQQATGDPPSYYHRSMKGVSFDRSKRNWEASWLDARTGRRVKKCFSEGRWGSSARDMAIMARKEAEDSGVISMRQTTQQHPMSPLQHSTPLEQQFRALSPPEKTTVRAVPPLGCTMECPTSSSPSGESGESAPHATVKRQRLDHHAGVSRVIATDPSPIPEGHRPHIKGASYRLLELLEPYALSSASGENGEQHHYPRRHYLSQQKQALLRENLSPTDALQFVQEFLKRQTPPMSQGATSEGHPRRGPCMTGGVSQSSPVLKTEDYGSQHGVILTGGGGGSSVVPSCDAGQARQTSTTSCVSLPDTATTAGSSTPGLLSPRTAES